ncbi:MAG: hypothetical protein EON93_02910 [Burkholderiales bacterium]|nr:MAG: hypothetical protein EON93_02910 [Burkholderiales bacterium]
MTSALGKPYQWLIIAGVVVAVVAVLVLGREQTALPGNLSDGTVVATLGPVSKPYPEGLRAAVKRARETPTNRDAAYAAASAYLDYGREIGDARYVGAALGVLEPWLVTSPDAQILNLAASGRQYTHDFAGAISLLDQVLSANPRNAQALLSRANIRIVQGDFPAAEEDCRGLARARRADLAILCDTTAKALTAEAPLAFDRLNRLIETRAMDPGLMAYADGLLAEIARFQGKTDIAKQKFEAAHASSPEDLRTLMILVDFDLAEGRPQDALAKMSAAPVTDAIMVRQVEGHLATGNTAEADRIGNVLRGQFAEAITAGDTAHAREASRYWLAVGESRQALEAATANWTNQRELEDALLFLKSAVAAGNPAAADTVVEWAAKNSVVAPMYQAALKQFEAASR